MGDRRYPPLKLNQIIQILTARGYSLHKKKGDHRYYIKTDNGRKRIAQVDMGCREYNENLIPMLLKETGLTREEFYGSTKKTAKMINVECILPETD
jgi:predicted RNA binding protein YcfA (HicA-like mRNA interferase family)